jgi:hypothetical protein
MVVFPDTVIDPWAMMVESSYTFVTYWAMFASIFSDNFTDRA